MDKTDKVYLKITANMIHAKATIKNRIAYGKVSNDFWEDIADWCFDNNIPLGEEITVVDSHNNLCARFTKQGIFQVGTACVTEKGTKTYFDPIYKTIHIRL